MVLKFLELFWTWLNNGSSLNSDVTTTSIDSGKVINVEVISKYCICKKRILMNQTIKRILMVIMENGSG